MIYNSLPNLITLTSYQRHIIPKMGDKTLAFVSKALYYDRQNPNIVPKYLNPDEYCQAVIAVNQLFKVVTPLQKLTEELDDTMMMAGSEAYTASLAFYSALKTAIASGETGLKNIYDDLSARFPSLPMKSISVEKLI